MVSKNRLSKLMKLSWAIQRSKQSTRSKSLMTAWAIINNEDVTVLYLVQKLNRQKPIKPTLINQFGLF